MCQKNKNTQQIPGIIFLNDYNMPVFVSGSQEQNNGIGVNVSFHFFCRYIEFLRNFGLFESNMSLRCDLTTAQLLFEEFELIYFEKYHLTNLLSNLNIIPAQPITVKVKKEGWVKKALCTLRKAFFN